MRYTLYSMVALAVFAGPAFLQEERSHIVADTISTAWRQRELESRAVQGARILRDIYEATSEQKLRFESVVASETATSATSCRAAMRGSLRTWRTRSSSKVLRPFDSDWSCGMLTANAMAPAHATSLLLSRTASLCERPVCGRLAANISHFISGFRESPNQSLCQFIHFVCVRCFGLGEVHVPAVNPSVSFSRVRTPLIVCGIGACGDLALRM